MLALLLEAVWSWHSALIKRLPAGYYGIMKYIIMSAANIARICKFSAILAMGQVRS